MTITAIILSILIVFFLLYIACFTYMLKEKNTPKAPYSFSRFQLWVWTTVVAPCFVLQWGAHTGEDPAFNETALILLGISGTVTVFSWVVNSVRREKQNKDHKTIVKADRDTKGFWVDLLMDSNGDYSVTRLQQLLFTLIYSVIYVSIFFPEYRLPDFDKTAYILMGISSGGYLVGKSVE